MFSELPIWILLGLVIARCSGSPGRAAAYAFVFFLAMIPAYYLAAEWMGGVWGITYVYGWAVVAGPAGTVRGRLAAFYRALYARDEAGRELVQRTDVFAGAAL